MEHLGQALGLSLEQPQREHRPWGLVQLWARQQGCHKAWQWVWGCHKELKQGPWDPLQCGLCWWGLGWVTQLASQGQGVRGRAPWEWAQLWGLEVGGQQALGRGLGQLEWQLLSLQGQVLGQLEWQLALQSLQQLVLEQLVLAWLSLRGRVPLQLEWQLELASLILQARVLQQLALLSLQGLVRLQ